MIYFVERLQQPCWVFINRKYEVSELKQLLNRVSGNIQPTAEMSKPECHGLCLQQKSFLIRTY